MEVVHDDNDGDNDDERKKSKKAKLVSNDRSGHGEQFCLKIVNIGITLVG